MADHVVSKEEKVDFQAFSIRASDEAYIGDKAVIFSGITVGTGAVIGTGAIVTKDVPPYAVVSGMPGKITRYRFSDDVIERLLKSRWWEYDPDDIIALEPQDVEQFLDKLETPDLKPAFKDQTFYQIGKRQSLQALKNKINHQSNEIRKLTQALADIKTQLDTNK